MSRGSFYRAGRSRPRGMRRAARFGGAGRAPRANRVPPSIVRGGPRRRGGRGGMLSRFLLASMLGLVVILVGAVGVAAAGGFATWSYVTYDLPSGDQIEAPQFETTKIYDRNWQLLNEVADPQTGWRTSVGYQEIQDHIAAQQGDPTKPQRAWIFDATVAAEDATFWTNPGVDPMAIARGLVINLSGEGSSGASTITQQLVRALYPEEIGYERSYLRKVREALTAYKFNQKYTKEQILEMYLNTVYYGNRSYGIDAASESYFNKHPWDLSLAEASMLAGLPQAPSLYDPTQNFEPARTRQLYVLTQMVKQGMITQADADAAYAQPLSPQTRDNRYDLAPHFVNFVKYYLEQKYGADVLYRGGLTVRTSLDYNMQVAAQDIVSQHVQRLRPWDVNNGAMVAMLPWSGEVVAMVGSADYNNAAIDGQVNVATRERQPGSSIKPITYLAAFERGWNPGTIIFDYNKRWPTPGAPQPYYAPRNATGQSYGAITVRDALANSLNVPAVQTLDFVGVPNMIDLAHKMGIRTGLWRGESFYGLAVTLGGGEVTLLEHTNAYATLANNGRYVPYTPVLEIIDKDGKKLFELDRGSTLASGEQVATAEHAYQITSILADDNARTMVFGRGSALDLPEIDRPAAAKTGTTEDSRDGWTMGYTTDLVVGVWVGNTDNHPTRSLDGVSGAGPIWHDMMLRAHTDPTLSQTLLGPDGQPLPTDFPRPPGIIDADVCTATGKKPIPGAQTKKEVLVQGEGPTQACNEATDAERKELAAALGSNSRFASGALQRLNAYATMVGGTRGPAPSNNNRGGAQTSADDITVPADEVADTAPQRSVAALPSESDVPGNGSSGAAGGVPQSDSPGPPATDAADQLVQDGDPPEP